MARLSEQLTGARLAALQAQLNPHFLFNSLNTIAVLVRDGDRATATRVIEQLSEVLRSTLSRTQAIEVSLEEELQLVRQYLAVEQARFSDRLRPAFEIDPRRCRQPCRASRCSTWSRTRCGTASRRRTDAGRVVVTARRDGDMLELSVEDDGAGLTSAAGAAAARARRAGHGLENTRERLRTLYGDRASLVVTAAAPQGTIARLRIPFREIVLEATDDAQR